VAGVVPVAHELCDALLDEIAPLDQEVVPWIDRTVRMEPPHGAQLTTPRVAKPA
jgi:hypothetical protein